MQYTLKYFGSNIYLLLLLSVIWIHNLNSLQHSLKKRFTEYIQQYIQRRGATRVYGNYILRYFIWGQIYDKLLKRAEVQNLLFPIPVVHLIGPFYFLVSSSYHHPHFIIKSHVKLFYIKIKNVTSVFPHTSIFIILGFHVYQWTSANKSLYYDCS